MPKLRKIQTFEQHSIELNRSSDLTDITIKSKKNDLFFIKIHFDEKGRVDRIENKWDVKLPEWYGFNINEIEINNWIRRKEPDLYIQK